MNYYDNGDFINFGMSVSMYSAPTSTPVGIWDFYDYRAMWNQPAISSNAQPIIIIPINSIYFPFGQVYP